MPQAVDSTALAALPDIALGDVLLAKASPSHRVTVLPLSRR
jgi:hypothetical protein